jgi:hypothetical protein
METSQDTQNNQVITKEDEPKNLKTAAEVEKNEDVTEEKMEVKKSEAVQCKNEENKNEHTEKDALTRNLSNDGNENGKVIDKNNNIADDVVTNTDDKSENMNVETAEEPKKNDNEGSVGETGSQGSLDFDLISQDSGSDGVVQDLVIEKPRSSQDSMDFDLDLKDTKPMDSNVDNLQQRTFENAAENSDFEE